ncbi:MAG: CPBP family intramembrane glutamic endopeptidase [Bacteroidales bacterium]
MFFESALEGKTRFWRYLVIFIAAFLASNTIGAIPLMIILFSGLMKDPTLLENGSNNLADLTNYGIDPNLGLVVMLFPFIVGLATVFLLVKPLNGRSWLTLFNGTLSVRWKRFFFSFFLWGIIMAIFMVYSLKSDPGNFVINNRSSSLIVLALIAITLMPFQTTFEEVLFRGYLMQGIGTVTRSKWTPFIITSVLFALMHSLNPEIKEFGFWLMIPQYLVFGLVFGLITILDDGIELAMGAHAANNIFLSIFITQKASALQTVALYEQQEVYPLSDLVSLLVISAAFVLVLGFIYGWNWREAFKYKKIGSPQ